MKYTAIIEGERLEIELNRKGSLLIEAAIGGRRYAIEAKSVEPGVFWFNWNNRSMEIAVTRNGEGYVVSLESRRLSVELVDSRARTKRSTAAGYAGVAELRAPMPGKVVKLLVGEGSEVRINQGILVMEAMKMQNEIQSPKAGVVKKLGVAEGTAVTAGDLLALIE